MTPLLTTKGLSRNFGGLRAVDNVDFTLMPGEIRAVIGPNGAGKTTFVSLVSGRIQPSSGMIVFDGADITGLPAYARVRMGIAYTLGMLGTVAQRQRRHAEASASFAEALGINRDLNDRIGIAQGLERLAGIAAATGWAERAARLFGAAAELREEIGAPLQPAEQADLETAMSVVRLALGVIAFD